jgi:uncharacterized protein (DUF1501 family)
MKKLNRRQFIKNSGLVTLAGLGGAQVGFGRSLLKGTNGNNSKDLLIYIFLNGGMDGLNLLPPRSGANYNEYKNALRPNLHIPNTESLALNGNSEFGFHPLATGMRDLFNQNKMAIVHATGLLESNKSHFVTTSLMERGVQDNSSPNLGTGWITRYFASSLSTPDSALLPAVVPSYNNTDAVLGDPAALVMGSPNEFSLNLGHWAWESSMQATISEIFTNPSNQEGIIAHQTLNASAVVQGIDWANYVPGNGAQYPIGFFGDQLKTIAQLFKEDVDLEVAYIPSGGWDTHIGQGTGTTGEFASLVQSLSDGLSAFYQDLNATHAGKFTIIVQSEFGRRAYENDSNGTDHGYGNPMFVIGDDVNGGFYGQYPGLQFNQLFEEGDVDVTVDYRDVVSEVLLKRMQNRFLGFIFPGYTGFTPMGIVSGADLNPVYDFDFDPLFKSGFD